jgi:hypothetical protein
VRKNQKELLHFDLSTYYNMITYEKNKHKVVIKQSFIDKFKTHYFNPLLSLYKQYEEFKWSNQRTHLGLNILTTFIFLIKIDAKYDILKIYRPYFIMNNSEIDRFNDSNNIIRGFDLSNEHHLDTAKAVIELFTVAHIKQIQSLGNTKECYLKYIVNLTLMNSGQCGNSHYLKFTKIYTII